MYDSPSMAIKEPGIVPKKAPTHKAKDGAHHLHSPPEKEGEAPKTDLCILDVTVPVTCRGRFAHIIDETTESE